jgi:hypothetical protein
VTQAEAEAEQECQWVDAEDDFVNSGEATILDESAEASRALLVIFWPRVCLLHPARLSSLSACILSL